MNTEFRFGVDDQYEELIDFLNYVFGFNGTSASFTKLIPQYYAPESHPERHNLLALEEGRIKAAVGLADYEVSVCGERLQCTGIGNVAVHPFRRGKGYMKELMARAMEHMKEQGVHLAVLGGRRHRYRYFSYDRIGSALVLRFASHTVEHSLGKNRVSRLTLREIRSNEEPLLDAIASEIEGRLYHPIRPRDSLYRLMTGHHCRLFALTEGEDYRGYAVVDGDHVMEFSVDPQLTEELLVAIYNGLELHSLVLRIPPFATDHAQRLLPLAETYSVETVRSVSVLNYAKVILAFLKLKAATEPLPNGSLRLRIRGEAGEERLLIEVRHGCCSVTPCGDDRFDAEADHLEAMQLLFSPVCPARNSLPPHARLWLPLPFWVDPCEHF